MPTPRRRAGFSMIEIMVTLVLLGIVGAALTRLLVFQGRAMDRQTQTRAARSVARNGVNLVVADLRMVQDTLGIDSLSTNGRTIRVKVPYQFGLICAANAAMVTASLLPVDSAILAAASYGGYAFRNANGTYTYVNSSGTLPVSAGAAATCTGNAAGQAQIRSLSVNNRSGGVVDIVPGTATPSVATPLFLWQRITYSFANSTAFPGKLGLYRRVGNGTAEELMAPYDSSARFRFYFIMDDTSRTSVTLADTARIKGVDVVLAGSSPTKTFGTSTYQKADMVTSVFFRNIRN